MATWRRLRQLPLMAYGFRPMFLGCGLLALVAIPAWIGIRATQVSPWGEMPLQLIRPTRAEHSRCANSRPGATKLFTGSRYSWSKLLNTRFLGDRNAAIGRGSSSEKRIR